MIIERTVEGLLGRHEADNLSYPFDLGDWEDLTGTADIALATRRLRVTPDAGVQTPITYLPIPAREESLIILDVSYHLVGSPNNVAGGANLHQNGVGNIVDLRYYEPYNTATGGESFSGITQLIGGAFSALNQVVVPASQDTRTIVAYSNESNISYRDRRAGIALEAVSTLSSGTIGLGCRSQHGHLSWIQFSKFFAMSSRYVRVQDVPVGGRAAIRDDEGVELFSGSADGAGLVELDLITAGLPGPHDIVVYDAEETEAGLLAPEGGVWPGDTYARGADQPDKPVIYVVDVTESSVQLASSAFSMPEEA